MFRALRDKRASFRAYTTLHQEVLPLSPSPALPSSPLLLHSILYILYIYKRYKIGIGWGMGGRGGQGLTNNGECGIMGLRAEVYGFQRLTGTDPFHTHPRTSENVREDTRGHEKLKWLNLIESKDKETTSILLRD